jgi:catechol 2,3-dioxygenase-like lactoylglutathione lyase family enzyme
MLHHISLGVIDLERSGRFYDAALAALFYRRVWTTEGAIGYGIEERKDELALKLGNPAQSTGEGFHIALAAPSREAVKNCHDAALNAGGTDNGAPGRRLSYGPTYFAAFVLDPDGIHLEAVINT